MSIPAIFLLLVSASLHALWNFILKRSEEKYIAMGWQVIFGGVFAFLLLLIVGLPPRSMWMFALVSMLIEAIYFILLSNAYTDNDFSLIYPIARGTAPAFIMLWSVLFLHEELTTGGMIGIGLIVCGMITIGATSLIQNRGNRVHLKGIILALTVALMISFYTLVDGVAVQNGSPLSYGLLMFTLIPFPTTIYNLRLYRWKRFVSIESGSRLPIILAGVLGVIAYLMALFAYTLAPVSYSGAIRQVSVVIGAFLGWQFLGERMGGTRVIGALIIFSGISVIAIFG